MNQTDKHFRVVTKEVLEKLEYRFYHCGAELKEGDLVILGLRISSPKCYSHEDASRLVLKQFVLDQQTGILHELYKITNK